MEKSLVSVITSLQNPSIKHVIKLRDNRFRRRERLVVVDGVAEIRRAFDAGLVLESLFLVEPPSRDEQTLAARVPDRVVYVSESVLQKIAFGQNHRDAVGIFKQPERSLEALKLKEFPLVVVLDGLEKPGNVGAVFRSADAVGADAVVLCEGECDLFNPSVIRGSLGTIFNVPSAQATRDEMIAWLKQNNITPVTARVDAKTTLWEIDLRQRIAIIIGSEAHGLGDQWRSEHIAAINVRIPMHGSADSLNASVSAALLMFEAARQRVGR